MALTHGVPGARSVVAGGRQRGAAQAARAKGPLSKPHPSLADDRLRRERVGTRPGRRQLLRMCVCSPPANYSPSCARTRCYHPVALPASRPDRCRSRTRPDCSRTPVLSLSHTDSTHHVNDVWSIDLSGRDGFTWKSVHTVGERPSPREGHGACVLANRYLVIHGGYGHHTGYHNESYVVDTPPYLPWPRGMPSSLHFPWCHVAGTSWTPTRTRWYGRAQP